MGNPLHPRANHVYGYALIGICATLGRELPHTQEIKLGYETDYINKALSEDFKLRDFNIEDALFADNSNPFPVPEIEDWPLIGVLKVAEVIVHQLRCSLWLLRRNTSTRLPNRSTKRKKKKRWRLRTFEGGMQENLDFESPVTWTFICFVINL